MGRRRGQTHTNKEQLRLRQGKVKQILEYQNRQGTWSWKEPVTKKAHVVNCSASKSPGTVPALHKIVCDQKASCSLSYNSARTVLIRKQKCLNGARRKDEVQPTRLPFVKHKLVPYQKPHFIMHEIRFSQFQVIIIGTVNN